MESVDVYVRNEEILDDDETWDDRLLIEAYNKSVNSIKKKIAQRMGIVNGIDDEYNHEKEVSKKQKSSKKSQNKNKWSVGDFCRANYSVDGLDYEAKIKQILSDGQCIVRYYGYDNEEVVRLRDLKKSLGKQFRVMQRLAASQNENENSDVLESREYVSGSCAESTPEWTSVPAIPPPPPLNILSQSGIPESESEALSTMLMSWYMTGYHTGYYQGIMQSKKNLQKLPKK